MLFKATQALERAASLGEKVVFTFAQAVNFYISRKDINYVLASNIKKALDFFKDTPCSEITQARMTEYENHRYSGKVVENSTRAQACIITVQSIINFAADHGLCERVKFKKPKIKKKPVLAAPDSWIVLLLSQKMHLWLRCAVLIMTYQGVRPISMTALKWQDIDFETQKITFYKTKNFHVFSPKMHPDVVEALKAYKELSRDKELVFPMLKERHAASYINSILKYLCKKNNIPFYSTHKFGRHAFAHRLFKGGCSNQEVAQAGGWESDRVVSSSYGHLQRTHVDQLVCRVKLGG